LAPACACRRVTLHYSRSSSTLFVKLPQARRLPSTHGPMIASMRPPEDWPLDAGRCRTHFKRSRSKQHVWVDRADIGGRWIALQHLPERRLHRLPELRGKRIRWFPGDFRKVADNAPLVVHEAVTVSLANFSQISANSRPSCGSVFGGRSPLYKLTTSTEIGRSPRRNMPMSARPTS
jgi:hypothetical protein